MTRIVGRNRTLGELFVIRAGIMGAGYVDRRRYVVLFLSLVLLL